MLVCKNNSAKLCDCCGDCENTLPTCPICKESCNDFYINESGTVVGCENCISRVESYD